MEIQKLLKLWPQYQTWLKQNNINENNIEEKAQELIMQLKQDPEKINQLSMFFSSPELSNLAKQFNLSNEQLNKMKSIISPQSNNGNLTTQQLEMIKKFRK